MKYLDKLIEHAINNPNEWGGTLHITINDRKSCYDSVEKYFDGPPFDEYVSEEDLKNMKESDTVVEIQYYSRTPVGSFCSFKSTVEEAAKDIWDSVHEELFEDAISGTAVLQWSSGESHDDPLLAHAIPLDEIVDDNLIARIVKDERR